MPLCHWECSTPAGVSSSVFVVFWWTRSSLSSRWVYFAVGGSMWLSSENDGVWQQRANGCRRSSQSAKPLVMMWWWMRTAGVCRQALHPSQARTKHKAYRGMKCLLHLGGMRDVVLENKMRYLSILLLHCTVIFLSLFFFFFHPFVEGERFCLFSLCIFVSLTHIYHATQKSQYKFLISEIPTRWTL